MSFGTKFIIGGCAVSVLLALLIGNYHAASGFVMGLLGWLMVGLKERREVK